jgi:hypothetical protein
MLHQLNPFIHSLRSILILSPKRDLVVLGYDNGCLFRWLWIWSLVRLPMWTGAIEVYTDHAWKHKKQTIMITF